MTDCAYKKTPVVKFGTAQQPNAFDPCSKDKFSFLLPAEFATVHKIQVWHDGVDELHLESIRLQHEQSTPLFFDVQEKLTSGKVVERSATVTQGQTAYTISCVAGATAALPMINIIGSMGQTRFRRFDPTKESIINAITVGEVSELQLKFERDAGEWTLEKVEVATKVRVVTN